MCVCVCVRVCVCVCVHVCVCVKSEETTEKSWYENQNKSILCVYPSVLSISG